MRTTIFAAALIAASIGASSANAQMMLQKAVVSPGGGYATNGQTQMIATVAQPMVGAATNGTTVMQYGFWDGGIPVAGVAQSLALANRLQLQLWPNPTSVSTKLGIDLKASAPVEVILYDGAGREVSRTNYGERTRGHFEIPLDVSALASGSYTVAVSVPGEIAQQRISVVR